MAITAVRAYGMDGRIINMEKTARGFTIVELLIVIVVIGILAAITIVAYNGIQQRGRDAQRSSDISTIQKALELYHVDNGGYPTCSNTTYQIGGARGTCYSDDANFIASLSPKYLAKVPKDPVNTGDGRYYYMFGSKKLTDVTYSASADDNYVLFVSYESRGGPYATQLGANSQYNYISGSRN